MIFAWSMFVFHLLTIVAMVVEHEKVDGKFAFTDKESNELYYCFVVVFASAQYIWGS